ncbi:MAG: type II toxin-antitoxin system VapC family toxin [Verrucomicrobia bacterium]|nr:type II toxin-antitoxin system VapC family toxin [Verrucomicrobiota bacterium]
MIGIDTSFLVAWAVPEHPQHRECRALAAETAQRGGTFGLTAGILAEFVHVVTDPRRFAHPLDMERAMALAGFWAAAAEVVHLPHGPEVTALWLDWLNHHRLGRKRLLDTLIAATWYHAGIQEVFTLNPADFNIFDAFTFRPQPSGSP